MKKEALKEFLDRKVEEYNTPSFIENDPIVVPHQFTVPQDIEIAAFFAATFAWGNRTTIIQKCNALMQLMNHAPYHFIVNHKEKDLNRFEGFCHRTFNTTDLLYFISFLQHHFTRHSSLEQAFLGDSYSAENYTQTDEQMEVWLNRFYHYFFSLEHVPARTRKHVAAPFRKSACKRLNMFLRWMVRSDGKGVDFGIWKRMKPSQLICPLDLHVARVARRFNLVNRSNADWQCAVDLTRHLRTYDAEDPVKYDFALFALGVIEKF